MGKGSILRAPLAAILLLLSAALMRTPAASAAAGGDWITAANWSLDRVPVSTDDVCITAKGTYTVVVTNSALDTAGPMVDSLTVGGAASSGSQALEVLGQNPNNTIALHGTSIGANAATIGASGIVELAATDSTAISYLGSLGMTNHGQIVTLPRAGTSTLFGLILNAGTISIEAPTQLSGSSYTVTNERKVSIVSGGQLLSRAGGSPTFVNAVTGTLAIASGGQMEYGGGPQFVASGRITGTAPVVDDLALTGTGSGPVILDQLASSQEPLFYGSLAAGQKLTIKAAQAYWASTGTNAGKIVLSSDTTAGTDLQLNGTLVNTGTISLVKGAGGPRQISATGTACAIDNNGTLILGTQALSLGCGLTQEAAATIALTVSSVPAKGRFGTIASTQPATLGGNLTVTTTLSALPAGAQYPIMSFGTLTYPDTFQTYTYAGPVFHGANYDFNVGTVTLVAP